MSIKIMIIGIGSAIHPMMMSRIVATAKANAIVQVCNKSNKSYDRDIIHRIDDDVLTYDLHALPPLTFTVDDVEAIVRAPPINVWPNRIDSPARQTDQHVISLVSAMFWAAYGILAVSPSRISTPQLLISAYR